MPWSPGGLGPTDMPRVLLLGPRRPTAQCRVAGHTTDLAPATAAAVLRPHSGFGHPWPELLPRSEWGRGAAEPLVYTRVRPDAVVELVVDPAVDGPVGATPHGRPLRPDLHPAVLRADIVSARTGGDRRHLEYVDDDLPDATDSTQVGQ